MRKVFTFLLLGLFMISFVSALETLEVSVSLEKIGYDWDNVEQFKIDETTSKYGKYEIRNSVLGIPFLQLDKVADIELLNNSDSCGEDCFAEKEITLYEDGILIDDVSFETRQKDGSWIHQPIRSYQFSYQGEIQDYKTVCTRDKMLNVNGTYGETCTQVKDGTHIGKINYNLGEVVPAGTYLLRLDGAKKPSRTVDWKVKTNGIWTNEWAVWGNISLGDDAEVILNSPTDNEVVYDGSVTFNASANVTGGATLTNMTLYNNISGSWVANGTLSGLDPHNETIAHEFAITTSAGASITQKTGNAINVSSTNINVTSFIKTTSTTTTKGYIGSTVHGSEMGTCNFVGQVCTFSSPVELTANTQYYVTTDSNGASYDTFYHGSSITFPTNDYFVWDGRVDQAGTIGPPNNPQQIISINVSESSDSTTSTQTWTRTITAPTLWSVKACDSDGDCGWATSNFTVLLDTSAPTITVESPTGTLDYGIVGANETLNVTFTDSNIDQCWYDYNGTNVTIEGCVSGVKNSTQFLLESDNTNMTLYANDTLGNLNSSFISWDYTLLEIGQSYSESVQEGTTTNISANVTLESGKRVSEVVLNYNGTDFIGEYNEYSTNTYLLSISKNVPQVNLDSNITFYWNVTLEDGSYQVTSGNNQTILNLGVDDCSVFTNMLFNFTIVDERTQGILNGSVDNTTLRASITLSNPSSGLQILNFSDLYNKTNPSPICMETAIGNSTFKLDAIIEYSANDKFVEFYNIKNYVLNSSTDNQNITLYNLNQSEGQEFKITYKDENFNTVPGALIQIQRKYIDEGIFKTVEIPMISSAGYTIAHLVRNDIIYNLIIINEGEVVATFDNIVADCQNPTFTECVINVNSFSSGTEPEDFSNDGEFTAVLSYDKDTRTVSTTYAIVSGVPTQTNLNVTLWNNYGNTTICSDGLLASGGTLSCEIPESFGNSSAIIKLTSGGDVKRTATISLNSDPNDIYGSNLVFIGLTIILLIIGMSITDNPVILGVMLIFGVIILTVLNIVVSAGWIGGGATILWFIIGVVMLLIKGSNRQ